MTPLQSKLQHHLAGKNAEWSPDGARASWRDVDGAHVLLVASPLTAAGIVDAVVLALDAEARATVAFEGVATDVARRTALRFGVALLDASTLAEPTVTPHASDEPLLPPAEPVPFLVAHEEPLAAEAPAPSSPSVTEPALPWSIEPAAASADAAPLVHVEPHELLALPWNRPGAPVREDEDHMDVVETPRRPAGLARPTQMPDWGLPWPRPVPPTDGLSIADPNIWGNRERVQGLRDGIERTGSGSFGAVVPEGSAWLKRLRSFP